MPRPHTFARRDQGRKKGSQPYHNHAKSQGNAALDLLRPRLSQDCHKISPSSTPHPPFDCRQTTARGSICTLPSCRWTHPRNRRLTHTRARPVGVRATRPCAANGLANNGYIPPLQDISLNREPSRQGKGKARTPRAPNSRRARVADSATCLQCNQAHPFRGACCSCKLQGNVATNFATKIQLQLQVAKRQTPFNSTSAAPANGSFRPKQRISIGLWQTRKAARKNRYKKGIDNIIYLCYTIVAGLSGLERRTIKPRANHPKETGNERKHNTTPSKGAAHGTVQGSTLPMPTTASPSSSPMRRTTHTTSRLNRMPAQPPT